MIYHLIGTRLTYAQTAMFERDRVASGLVLSAGVWAKRTTLEATALFTQFESA